MNGITFVSVFQCNVLLFLQLKQCLFFVLHFFSHFLTDIAAYTLGVIIVSANFRLLHHLVPMVIFCLMLAFSALPLYVYALTHCTLIVFCGKNFF